MAAPLPSSSEVLEGLEPSVLHALNLNGHVFRYDEEKLGPVYIPDTLNMEEIRGMTGIFSPEIMVEALYKVPYPDNFKAGQDEILAYLYEISHRVSTISGVKYFSERRNRYAVLFTDVYAVDGDKSRIDDPVPGSTNYSDTLGLHMKENALGRGYYRLEYSRGQGSLSIHMTNESELGFILTAVESGEMQIVLQLVPCNDTILIYGYSGAIVQNDDFINLLLDPYFAFYRRMTAMETWLYNSLHGTDMLPPLYEPMP